MLLINYIREHKNLAIEGLQKRGLNAEDTLNSILELDDKRKALQFETDSLQAELNKHSKEIGKLFAQGNHEQANTMKQQVATIKETTKSNAEKLQKIKADLSELVVSLPNVPHSSVPPGNTDEDNEVFKAWSGDLPDLGDQAQPHWELAKKYNIFDLELGVKIAGAGFPVFLGQGAQLKRALINFFLEEGRKAGYLEVVPPLLVNEKTAFATGQLPDKDGQMYYVTEDDLFLIPTAEVPITNIYRDVIVNEDDFPIKLTGYTPCFRREAGSYGAHVRGLNRVHQFDKVEVVQIVHPEKSYDTLQEMLKHVEGLLAKLELPYRILRLCGGDLGTASALTFDFEVYSAAQKRWLEVSSVSNFETFQSNRLKLRYKNEKGKSILAHTLNGSALALARIVACLLENHQTEDGIAIPKALQSYTGFDMIS